MAGGAGDGGQQSRPKHLGASKVAAKLPGRDKHARGAAYLLVTHIYEQSTSQTGGIKHLHRRSVLLEHALQIQRTSLECSSPSNKAVSNVVHVCAGGPC